MSTLLLRFAAPLQAWGTESKYDIRKTDREPSKSGIVGFLAAALGRKRDESVEDLNALRVGVRADQEGEIIQDFHMVHKDEKTSYLTRRYYLSDAVFVVGVESEKAKGIMERLYKPFMMNNYRLIFTDIPSAEMIKYAANSMLATRISFMNDIANLCELVGADVNMVRKGIGADSRIGSKFLYSGCGYGGSCFPKDVKALIKTAEKNGYSMRVLKAVEEVNERQKGVLFEKLLKHYNGDLKDKQIALDRKSVV